ncbi:MAG: hypothetical protein IJ173_00660 [Kiritimatiellae bacterium]|nr:hypothetical protein [Kiritimatiellia bacterium]
MKVAIGGGLVLAAVLITVICMTLQRGNDTLEADGMRKSGLITQVNPSLPKERDKSASVAPEKTEPDSSQSSEENKVSPPKPEKKPRGNFQQDSPEVAAMRERVKFINIEWEHPSEGLLAGMIFHEPGDVYIETDFSPQFFQDLQQSLVTKIEIKDDDHPIVKEQKEAIIQLKKDMVDILKAGGVEALKAELEAAQKEIVRSDKIVRELREIMDEAMANATDAQELVDTEDAVNRLLKEKGIETKIASDYVQRLRRRLELLERRKAKGK